jgi:hypothetical protein
VTQAYHQLLLHELAQYGRTTYLDLLATYAESGYDIDGFRAAVYRLRKAGVVAPAVPGQTRGVIFAAGACPCCGRELRGEAAP